MRSHVVSLLLLALIGGTFGGNILFLNGVPSPSHHNFNRAIVLGLAAKGHNVTFVSVDVSKKQVPNVHYIHLERAYEVHLESQDSFKVLDYASLSPVDSILHLPYFDANVCDGVLASKGLDRILDYPKDFKFDAVLYDFTFGPCLLPLVTRFNDPPLISVSGFANPPFTTDLVGGQKYPAFAPHYAVDYSTEMTFFQRAFNTYLYFVDWWSREFNLYPMMDKKLKERFNFAFPPVKQISQQTSLILVNTDSSIDFPEPLQPNMIQVGGLQIAEPEPLPEEMEKFVKSGKKGTVLMSLGTNMKSNLLGEENLKKVLKAFALIPEYNFLWKFESEVKDLPIAPSKNVMIGKFLPQNDLLAHPNLKAFITHSGMLSTHEALWHGKPIIGMPIFVDQHRNLAKAMASGVGVKVDFRDFTVESLKASILSVVEDPKYSENTQKISKLFKDKPQKPLDVAVWWVEFAMRNPNLDNLRSPTIKLGPFASKSYDVLLAFIVCVHLAVFIFVKAIKALMRAIKGDKKGKNKRD